MLVARVVLGGSLHLTEDEAYYRLWAQRPAFGYFDHPPMIAWWIWAGVHLVGDTPLGVRLAPILASALTTALVFDMARLAGGSAVQASRAGTWYNAMLLIAAGGFLAVPDAPAALFWSFTLWAAQRARRGDGLAWWLLAGVGAGLACLSKYSALFLGPGVLIWLIATPNGRAALKTPGPWLALTVAAGLFGLNVAWNGSHHWLTFAKQFGRIRPGPLAPRYLPEFLGTQLLLLNPLLAPFLLRSALLRSAMAGRIASSRVTSVASFLLTSLPFVAYLLFHSLHDRIQAHWLAPVYPALAIYAALAPEGAGGGWRALRAAVPIFGLGLTGAAAALVAWPPAGAGSRYDPAQSIRGWPAFAERVEALRRASGAVWVGTASYGVAAQLKDEPAIAAPVVQISERARWRALAQGAGVDIAQPGLLVDLPRRLDLRTLGQCFDQVRPLGVLYRGAPGSHGGAYEVVLVSRPRRNLIDEGCGGLGASAP